MTHGVPGMLAEAWQTYANLDAARLGARRALRDPHVLAVAIVEDGNPLTFVEWLDARQEDRHTGQRHFPGRAD